MKKVILFTFAFIFTSALTLQAEILYTNYGDGWHIGLNENIVVDADMDGNNDFYINGHINELGFVPIFAKGCFSSPHGTAYNNLGSRELTIHQPGDMLDMSLNTMSFIDDDRGSAASISSNGSADLATGWVDGQDRYVGFYIFGIGRFGWIRVALDVNAQELIIKEMAVEMTSHGELEVGYSGQVVVVEPPLTPVNNLRAGEIPTVEVTSVQELEKNLQDIMIAPNPATERVNVAFEYRGIENLNIVIVNSVGKEVYRTANGLSAGEVNLDIPITDWNSGIYFIQFQNQNGVITERLSVVK